MSRILLIALLACVFVSGVTAGRSLAGDDDDYHNERDNRGRKSHGRNSYSCRYHNNKKDDNGKLKGNRLRVMTYNIFHGVGQDNVLNLTRTAQAIRRQNVDIVGLQEVDRAYSNRSLFLDEAMEIAKQLNWNYVFAANLNTTPVRAGTPPQFPTNQYGTAILTRFKILEATNTYLSKFLERAEQRGLAQAKLRVNGENMWFFNCHLSAAGTNNGENGPVERARQVLEVIDIVKNTTRNGRTPFVLTGDFNAKPNDTETAPLFPAFTDSWIAANGPEGGFTIPVGTPTRRIDYIFTNKESRNSPFKVQEAYVPADNLTLITSDHRPVVAQLKFRK